jgi:hypothetical protein
MAAPRSHSGWSRLASISRIARSGFVLIRMASRRCCNSLPTHKKFSTNKKIMFLVQKGDVPERELHLFELFFRRRRVSRSRLVRVTSFHLARVLSASHEKFLREALPRSFRLARGVPPRNPFPGVSAVRVLSASHEKFLREALPRSFRLARGVPPRNPFSGVSASHE